MTNIMIDIETLGHNDDALIASIGAVKFDVKGLNEEFYEVCYYGQGNRKMTLGTVTWWMKQSEEARKLFYDKSIKVVELKLALKALRNFIDFNNDKVWANGVSFDINILKHAYDEHNLKVPWGYSRIMCLRSIRSIYPEYSSIMDSIRGEVMHNALDDAKCQASCLIELAKEKGFKI